MKKANNNEMDLVLRGLAKRDDPSLDTGASFSDNNGTIGEHLDADELNSFAEGLVPEPARVRYMEHLADCSNCRRLVVSLTQPSRNLSTTPVVDKQRSFGFWQRMAAVFSPSVLRYAVPALALTAAIAIGLLALRQQRGRQFVARQQPETRETYSAQPQTTGESLNTSGKETSLVPQSPVETRQSTDSTKERNNAQPGQGEIVKAQTDTGVLDAAPSSKDEVPAPPPTAVEPGVSRTQPFFSPEPKAGYSAGRTVPGDVKKAEASKEEQPADFMAQTRERDESNFKRGKDAEDERAAPNVAAASGPRRAEAPMSARRAPLKNKQDSDGDETRSVSGKRFRRQGNIWVDFNYESSRATINVTRGSEQFRALVADEPGIRTIANQLGGEIIVVWKGKAYRIR